MTMTASITNIIGKQKQEYVKEQIATILSLEIAQQHTLSTTDTKAMLATFMNGSTPKIYLDRDDPLQETELNGIVIRNTTETYQDGSQVKKKVNATYEVLIIGGAPATDSEQGDTIARRTVQRVAKIAHKILNSGYYVNLGFAQGYIGWRKVKDLETLVPRIAPDEVTNLVVTKFDVEVYFDDEAITAAPVLLETVVCTIKPDTGAFVVLNGIDDTPPPDPDDEEEPTP